MFCAINFSDTNKPNCLNLSDIDLNNGYFNIKLDGFYNGFFNCQGDSSKALTAFPIGCKLLECFTRQIAHHIMGLNKNDTKIDVKSELFEYPEAKKFLTQNEKTFRKLFKININEINVAQMEKIANAVNLIFSTAGCKGEIIPSDETCYLNLTWENKDFLIPKFEISNSNKSSSENFNELRNKKLLFDCKIEVDTRLIPVHSCLFAVKSPVFLRMIENGWIKDNKITFPDENLKTIELFLDYLYQDYTIVGDDLEEILALTKFAHRYELKSLFNDCASLMHKKFIKLENIIDVYLFGEQLNSKLIIENCEHKSILINWNEKENNKIQFDFSSINDVGQLLKIYQIAQKLKLKNYMEPTKDKLLVIAENSEQFEEMQKIAKDLELDKLMTFIKEKLSLSKSVKY